MRTMLLFAAALLVSAPAMAAPLSLSDVSSGVTDPLSALSTYADLVLQASASNATDADSAGGGSGADVVVDAPEPGTWSMMILGAALLGGVTRTRRRSVRT